MRQNRLLLTVMVPFAATLRAILLPAAAAQASVVGIRLVFPEPAEGASCTPEEHNTLLGIMHEGVLELMENDSRMLVRDDGGIFDDGSSDKPDPYWCKRACRNFAKGSCYV
jgi:hypothetical protein